MTEDRRVQRTRRSLRRAMASLVHEKAFDAIAVKEVVVARSSVRAVLRENFSPSMSRTRFSEWFTGGGRVALAQRLTGLLLGLLMLHLGLGGAGVSCVDHVDHGMVSHQHMSAHHSSAHPASAAIHARSAATSTQNEAPAQPECCRAMTSCALIALRADMQLRDRPTVSEIIEPARMRVPRSLLTSPDPPPPKA